MLAQKLYSTPAGSMEFFCEAQNILKYQSQKLVLYSSLSDAQFETLGLIFRNIHP